MPVCTLIFCNAVHQISCLSCLCTCLPHCIMSASRVCMYFTFVHHCIICLSCLLCKSELNFCASLHQISCLLAASAVYLCLSPLQSPPSHASDDFINWEKIPFASIMQNVGSCVQKSPLKPVPVFSLYFPFQRLGKLHQLCLFNSFPPHSPDLHDSHLAFGEKFNAYSL